MTKNKKVMDTEMIDKAYEYCRNMNCWKDEEEFLAYWCDNYVKFCDDFLAGKYIKKKTRSASKKNKNVKESEE